MPGPISSPGGTGALRYDAAQTLTSGQASQGMANLFRSGTGAAGYVEFDLSDNTPYGLLFRDAGVIKAGITCDPDHGGAGVAELKIESEGTGGTIYIASNGRVQIGSASDIHGMSTQRHTGAATVGAQLKHSVADLHQTTGYNSGSPIGKLMGWQAIATDAATGQGVMKFFNDASVNSSTGLVTGTHVLSILATGLSVFGDITTSGKFVGPTPGVSTVAFAPLGVVDGSTGFFWETTAGAFRFGTGSHNIIRYIPGSTGYFNFDGLFQVNLAAGTLSTGSFTPSLAWSSTLVTASLPFVSKSYTVGTLPSASPAAQAVYVSDAAVAPCLAISNGTNWKRSDDAATTVV